MSGTQRYDAEAGTPLKLICQPGSLGSTSRGRWRHAASRGRGAQGPGLLLAALVHAAPLCVPGPQRELLVPHSQNQPCCAATEIPAMGWRCRFSEARAPVSQVPLPRCNPHIFPLFLPPWGLRVAFCGNFHCFGLRIPPFTFLVLQHLFHQFYRTHFVSVKITRIVSDSLAWVLLIQ